MEKEAAESSASEWGGPAAELRDFWKRFCSQPLAPFTPLLGADAGLHASVWACRQQCRLVAHCTPGEAELLPPLQAPVLRRPPPVSRCCICHLSAGASPGLTGQAEHAPHAFSVDCNLVAYSWSWSLCPATI